MSNRHLTLLFALVALAACQPEPPPPVVVELGVHRVEFEVPPGWLHANHGREQRFEKEMTQISLADLGPATPEGFAEAIGEARELFRAGQWEDARSLLVSLDPRRFFASEKRWAGVRREWTAVTRIRREDGFGPLGEILPEVALEVEASFHHLLVEVGSMPQLDLEALAASVLEDFDRVGMRAVAEERAMAISGRPAIRIDTWDRLSHLHRFSHLFVLSEGRLLCLRMESGLYETLEPAFDALVTSLVLAPRPEPTSRQEPASGS